MDLQLILVATDFSDCSAAAFQSVRKLAQTFKAKIVLLHVVSQKRVQVLADYLKVEPNTLIPKLREQAQEQLGEFIKRWWTEGVEVETMVTVGLPFQEIAVMAQELAVDLVALGGCGRGGRTHLEDVFFGSTAERVVRLLPCPVLCVPLTEEQK